MSLPSRPCLRLRRRKRVLLRREVSEELSDGVADTCDEAAVGTGGIRWSCGEDAQGEKQDCGIAAHRLPPLRPVGRSPNPDDGFMEGARPCCREGVVGKGEMLPCAEKYFFEGYSAGMNARSGSARSSSRYVRTCWTGTRGCA